MRKLNRICNSRLFYILPILLLTSCSIDYDKYLESTVKDKKNITPSMIADNFSIKFVKDSKLKGKAFAKQTKVYSEIELQEFNTFSFETYDDEGVIETVGKSKRAQLYTNREDIELIDDVFIDSKKEKINLKSSFLKWINSNKILFGKIDKQVVIEKENGDILKGEGFSFDARKKLLEFTRNVSGIMEDGGDEKNEQVQSKD